MKTVSDKKTFATTRNACKLCAPLGACLAFKGIEGAVPLVHGSQGCATYIRRYLIGHYREPIDVASSSFSEHSTIFGGEKNLHQGLDNVTTQYNPKVIGVASTCLSETIGDDLKMILNKYRKESIAEEMPHIINVSTPSYSGTHAEGFHATVCAVVDSLAEKGVARHEGVNLLPGLVSPADIRHLKDILAAFGLTGVILPDYSDTLDGTIKGELSPIPEGGTSLSQISDMGGAKATIGLGACVKPELAAEVLLSLEHGVTPYRLGLPIGVRECDRFFDILSQLSGRPIPDVFVQQRGRLIDAYVDSHKYIFGKRVIVYGEEDLVVGLACLVAETGGIPVLCASGGKSGRMKTELEERLPALKGKIQVSEGMDHVEIQEACGDLKPDLLLGSSKGYTIAKELGIPLVRAGFPVHDRVGGARMYHLGYRGTQDLHDRLINAILEEKQNASPVGYGTF